MLYMTRLYELDRALLLENQNRDQEAMSSYLQSIHYRPNLALAYLNLGLVLAKQGHYDQACHWLRSCSQLGDEGIRDLQTHRKTKTSALHQWGKVEASRGRHDLAIQLYQQALRTHPTNNQLQMLYNSLGESYQATGDIQETEKWYRMALHVKPDHVASHLTYARLLAKNISRQDEAEQLFLKAQLLAPTDSSVYMLTGQFLLDISRPEEAAECFIRAAHLSPGDFEAVFNAATTLREIQQLERAELFYRQAVRLKPHDITVYRNLGAMLHVNGKWHEAEHNYLRALQLVPDDHVTLINLKRLYQVMKAKGITPRHRPIPCPSGS